jgi:hypothetical protein
MPDDVLGRIDGALEDWERGPDVARWHADGGPDDLAEWVAYCAPGRRAGASLAISMSAYADAVTDVRESPILEGSGVVLVRTEALELPPLPPLGLPVPPGTGLAPRLPGRRLGEPAHEPSVRGGVSMAGGYPDGYRDPPWTTAEDFASTVIPARAEALTEALNASLPDWAKEAGLRLEWSRPADDPIGTFTGRMLEL